MRWSRLKYWQITVLLGQESAARLVGFHARGSQNPDFDEVLYKMIEPGKLCSCGHHVEIRPIRNMFVLNDLMALPYGRKRIRSINYNDRQLIRCHILWLSLILTVP
jgi:hypothetical protein